MSPSARDPGRTGHAANPVSGDFSSDSAAVEQQSSARAPLSSSNGAARRPVGPSPQQIMRARYKQQMMQPRTWRQQEERRKEIDAASRQRLSGSDATKRAAAAAASNVRSPAPRASHPVPPQQRSPSPASPRTSQSTSRALLVRARSGSLEAAQTVEGASRASQQQKRTQPPSNAQQPEKFQQPSLSSLSQPNSQSQSQSQQQSQLQQHTPKKTAASPRNARPVIERRRSSQISISRAAAVQAQVTQSPHRESVGSVHSTKSSIQSDDASSTSTPSEALSSSPASPQANATAASSLALAGANAPSASAPSSSTASTLAKSSAGAKASAAESNASTSQRRTMPQSLRWPNRAASQFGGVPAPPEPSRSVTASAAARASAASPITINPREPLSSKFVSSLGQALRREIHERQETRSAEERAKEGQAAEMEKIIGKLTTSESFRSVVSDGSGESISSVKSPAQLQAARLSGSYDRHKANQQAANADAEREKKKANALSAALAAGGKAESEMARIHMQVNLAVQDALQTASRRELTKRYRPSSHWSAPVEQLRRPPLKRLVTSDSALSGHNITEVPSTPPSMRPWRVKPGRDDAKESEQATPVTPSSSTHSFGSVPMHPSYSVENVASASSVPSLVNQSSLTSGASDPVPHSAPASAVVSSPITPKSAEPSRWKTWTQSVLSRQRGAPKPKPSEEKSLTSKAGLREPLPAGPEPMSPGPSATYLPAGLSGQPPITRQEPMLHTLRGRTMRNKRFNEDKPWKNHQGLYHLSETERKRYEKLWAANRCTHLPFLFVNPDFEGMWHAAVSRRFPHLYKKEGSSDQDSVKTSGSMHSQSQSSPISWNQDYGDAASVDSSLRVRRSVDMSRNPDVNSQSRPYRSPHATAEPFHVDNVQDIISASGPYHRHSNSARGSDEIYESRVDQSFDRDISPESVISEGRENGELAHQEPRSPLDDLRSIASSIEKDVDKQAEDVHGYVVSRLWRRSRLPEETLAEIWDLVDTNRDGTLDRSSFVVGMWLCDQCLYGRKLPARVPYEVWQSVGKLHLKVRFKQPKSKSWYMSQPLTFMGSAVGHTMHGSRQVVKKVVQTATS